jgi:hypothetical protein
MMNDEVSGIHRPSFIIHRLVESRIDAPGNGWYSSAMTIAAGYFYEIGGRRGSMLAVDHRRAAPKIGAC